MEGAFVLSLTLLVLLATHREFQRGGSLLDQGFPAEWVSTVMAILRRDYIAPAIFSYRQFAYSHELSVAVPGLRPSFPDVSAP